MTRKLNQDCLERFFGCIRQMSGPHDHPDSVTFKKRLKKYVLGKDARLLSDINNVGQDNDDGKCLREVMTNSKIKDSYDRELDLELCTTSLIFENMDMETDFTDDDQSNDINEFGKFAFECDAEQNTSTIIEE